MKNIKYFLSIIMILLCIFTFTSCGGTSKIDSEKLPYAFNEETKVLTINFNTINYNDDSYRPWNNYAKKISKIVVKEGVTSIGSYAFYECENVKEVILPETLTTIGEGAFSKCQNLEKINIPNSVISIEKSNFPIGEKLKFNEDENAKYLGNETNPYHVLVKVKDIGVSSFEFNPNTKIILEGAFASCGSLTSIDIPEGVLEIGNFAFVNCEKLTKVNLPNSLLNIYSNSFYGTSNLVYKYNNRDLYLGNSENEYLVCYKVKQSSGFAGTNISFHPKTQIIANNAVDYNPMLKTLNLPSTLKTLGKGNFDNCGMLETVVLKDNPYLTLVDGVVYNKDVTKLLLFPKALKNKKWMVPETLKEISEDVSFAMGIHVYFPGTLEDWCNLNFKNKKNNPILFGTLFMKDSTGEYGVVTEITIPPTVTYIGDYQFVGTNGITKITIPNSVLSIGSEAFGGNKELIEIKGGKSVAYIMSSAFVNCEKLAVIPDFSNLINLEAGAFYNCPSLEKINISASVKLIGDSAFFMCSSLKSINVKKSNEYYSSKDGVLYNKDQSCLIAYPMAKNNTSFTFPETVKEIKENVFGNNPYLKKVELNSSIKIIPNYAFSNCSNLTEITIPNSVEEIGFNAFFGCKNLKEVHIPKSVEKMGIMAFYSNHEELVIHCEHDKEPSGWIGWQDADEVIWGYTG